MGRAGGFCDVGNRGQSKTHGGMSSGDGLGLGRHGAERAETILPLQPFWWILFVPWPDGRENLGKRARRKVEVQSIETSAK